MNGDFTLKDQTLVPTYSQFKQEKITTTPLQPRPRMKMPPVRATTPSISNGDYLHQVCMREDDFNMLTRSGHIFFLKGKPHYTHHLD